MMERFTDPRSLAAEILASGILENTLDRAVELLRTGVTAGTVYPEVWIRDLATFVRLSCRAGNQAEIRSSLLKFFDFQQPDGGVIDGYTGRGESVEDYDYILSPRHPGMVGHKNTVATDQESSLVIAVRRYVEETGDAAFLEEPVDGLRVLDRLGRALDWVYSERWSEGLSLAWNATTIDWGDVQPEHEWGVQLSGDSHPAVGIYPNAMLSLALRDLEWLRVRAGRDAGDCTDRRNSLHGAIRKHLWDERRQKFRPHIYLEKGSPFPPEFDEDPIYYHGGTAVAMLAGLLTRDEARASAVRMQRNVAESGARSVGLTVWPVYNVPSAVNRIFRTPFLYQNGGDWPWFGGRVSLGLLECGLPGEAFETLLPIVEMVETHDGFFEWHAPDGTPSGAKMFRGAAGVVGEAITELRAWAESICG